MITAIGIEILGLKAHTHIDAHITIMPHDVAMTEPIGGVVCFQACNTLIIPAQFEVAANLKSGTSKVEGDLSQLQFHGKQSSVRVLNHNVCYTKGHLGFSALGGRTPV